MGRWSRSVIFFTTLFLTIGMVYFVFKEVELRYLNKNSFTTEVSTEGSNTGIIEGSLGYPSENIPSEMMICAENIFTSESFCTNKHIKGPKYIFQRGFKLSVPEGQYFVYAKIPESDYKAYYSDFITCGLKDSCRSHDPIIVEVKKGQTVMGVDPYDWYAREAF